MPALATSVEHDLDADVTLVTTRGRLDSRSAPILRGLLLKHVAECPAGLVVDVTDCTSDSAAALTLFPTVAGTRDDHLPGVLLVVCGADEGFLGGARRAALGPVPVHPTLAEALRAVATIRAGHRQVRLFLPQSRASPARARYAVAEVCRDWDLDHLLTPAQLVVSELVTNAVLHAHSEVELEMVLRDDFLHIRVRDGSAEPPALGAPTPDPTPIDHGRGLPIIAHHATAWGYQISRIHPAKSVWATLHIPRSR